MNFSIVDHIEKKPKYKEDQMAKRRKKRKTKKSPTDVVRKSGRDWRKIAFYVFSITIVLSMVLALFVGLLTGTGGGAHL